jgi:hypothetical protein
LPTLPRRIAISLRRKLIGERSSIFGLETVSPIRLFDLIGPRFEATRKANDRSVERLAELV